MQDGLIIGLLNEKELEALRVRISNQVLGWFLTLCNVSASVIGCLMILTILKWIIDAIIHCTVLYEV